jgi:hypothetical protein
MRTRSCAVEVVMVDVTAFDAPPVWDVPTESNGGVAAPPITATSKTVGAERDKVIETTRLVAAGESGATQRDSETSESEDPE